MLIGPLSSAPDGSQNAPGASRWAMKKSGFADWNTPNFTDGSVSSAGISVPNSTIVVGTNMLIGGLLKLIVHRPRIGAVDVELRHARFPGDRVCGGPVVTKTTEHCGGGTEESLLALLATRVALAVWIEDGHRRILAERVHVSKNLHRFLNTSIYLHTR